MEDGFEGGEDAAAECVVDEEGAVCWETGGDDGGVGLDFGPDEGFGN